MKGRFSGQRVPILLLSLFFLLNLERPSASAPIIFLGNSALTVATNAELICQAFPNTAPLVRVAIYIGSQRIAQWQDLTNYSLLRFSITNNMPGAFDLIAEATDSEGATGQASMKVYFPSAVSVHILQPAPNQKFFVGEQLRVSTMSSIDFGKIDYVSMASQELGSFTQDQNLPSDFVLTLNRPGHFRITASAYVTPIYVAGDSIAIDVVPFGIGTIIAQPLSTNVDLGSPATFSVEIASMSQVTYQWRFNDQPIPGETNSTLLISSVTTNNAGAYCVWITNESSRLISDSATLTIRGYPVPKGGGKLLLTNKGPGVDAPVYDYYTSTFAEADNVGQFYAGPSLAEMIPIGHPIPFNAGYVDFGSVTLPNVAPGQLAYVQLYAWYGSRQTWVKGKSTFLTLAAGTNEASPLVGLQSFHTIHTDGYYWIPWPGGMTDGASYMQHRSVAQRGKPISISGPTGIGGFNSTNASHSFSYTWSRDGQILNGITSATLNFPNPTLSDAGNYRLFVHDDIDVAFIDFSLSVDATPPQLSTKPVVINKLPNLGAQLKLAAVPGSAYRIEFSHDMTTWFPWKSGSLPQSVPTVELNFWTAFDNDGGNHTNTPFGFFRASVNP